jgi:hypothetical protein
MLLVTEDHEVIPFARPRHRNDINLSSNVGQGSEFVNWRRIYSLDTGFCHNGAVRCWPSISYSSLLTASVG